MVKIVNGKFKGRKGVIKYIFKTIVFLWDRDFQQTNGLFVESTKNLVILGGEHIKGREGSAALASMNKRIRDPLLGKEVLITGGPYKGYRGKVCRVDDKQAIVEFSSICKKIPIERSLVKDF